MHLRSPAGPISVYVLNPPDPEAIPPTTNSLQVSEAGMFIISKRDTL